MQSARRELLVARILSGSVRIRIAGEPYVVRRASVEDAYTAQEIYAEQFYEAGRCMFDTIKKGASL